MQFCMKNTLSTIFSHDLPMIELILWKMPIQVAFENSDCSQDKALTNDKLFLPDMNGN